MNILETHNLRKQFGNHIALDNVNLSMEQGSIYGLLGPNGAGKTTFLRLVNNILAKDSGEILFKGEPMSIKLSKHLGYMPEERGLYSKMQVEEQILFFGMLKGKSRYELQQTMRQYMEIFSISQADTKRKVSELSKGNQQKVQIIATLVHEPELVMLDEPFSGFDPINGALLSALIDRLKEKGATIVLSSHNMAAVEEICSHMALINHGKLLVNGRIKDIKNENKENTFIISTSTPVSFSELEERGIVRGTQLPERNADDPFSYNITLNTSTANNEVIIHACKQSKVLHFEEKLPRLADLFIKYTNSHNPQTDGTLPHNGDIPCVSDSPFERVN